MKKMVAVLTVMVLLLSVCSCSFASTKAQLLGLKNHLEETIPDELVWDNGGGRFSNFLTSSYWAIDEDDGEYVGVVIKSSKLDAYVLDYINQTEDADTSKGCFIIFLMALAGKIAKQAKLYGVTDTNIIIYFSTDKDTVGAELAYGVVVNVDEDYVNVAADEIFGLTGPISISECYDENYNLNGLVSED